VPERVFTPAEANAALAEVRPLAEEMVRERRKLVRAGERRAELATRIAGNGGGIAPSEMAEVAAELERAARAVSSTVERIHALGALVKDLDTGLVDFPARHRGRDILLCWRLGEDEVAHWHGREEGFAGRRPLPLD
jgi:hypothetical protein